MNLNVFFFYLKVKTNNVSKCSFYIYINIFLLDDTIKNLSKKLGRRFSKMFSTFFRRRNQKKTKLCAAVIQLELFLQLVNKCEYIDGIH